MQKSINVIGGGLAGCEAAYQIAKRKINVNLYEMKPKKFSPIHKNKDLAEIVCSNSFKSNNITNACGLLKEELRMLDSMLICVADTTSIPAGQALAVDRDVFAKKVTEEIKNNKYINVIEAEIGKDLPLENLLDNITIISSGPLTSDNLVKEIIGLTGREKLRFFDAVAPIVTKESIDFNIAFYGERYGKGENSYINLPMNKSEYENFYKELIQAEVVNLHSFEKKEIFEGCMPIEIMAKRGEDTIRFGPLKPVGFIDPHIGKQPYAIVQLRQDNKEGTLYNIVGFQTNLKFKEQKRVFSLIPGLENVEIVRYGVMHANTYIDSPKLLYNTYKTRFNSNIYFAGQITGVEGYVESISSGLVAGINAANQFLGKEEIIFPRETIIGALSDYISSPKENFSPMNANFGILPELNKKIKDKQERYKKYSNTAIEKLQKMVNLIK